MDICIVILLLCVVALMVNLVCMLFDHFKKPKPPEKDMTATKLRQREMEHDRADFKEYEEIYNSMAEMYNNFEPGSIIAWEEGRIPFVFTESLRDKAFDDRENRNTRETRRLKRLER